MWVTKWNKLQSNVAIPNLLLTRKLVFKYTRIIINPIHTLVRACRTTWGVIALDKRGRAKTPLFTLSWQDRQSPSLCSSCDVTQGQNDTYTCSNNYYTCTNKTLIKFKALNLAAPRQKNYLGVKDQIIKRHHSHFSTLPHVDSFSFAPPPLLTPFQCTT